MRRWVGGAQGYALVLVLVLVATLTLTGVTALGLARHDLRRVEAATDDRIAAMLAEVAARRALALLEVAPAWRTAPGQPLRGSLPVDAVQGTYEVRVEDTGQSVGGMPLVQIVATGHYREEAQTIQARAYVRPPRFFQAALSLFNDYDSQGKGELETVGDVYVSGSFRHDKRLCVQGDLIVERVVGPRPRQEECRGKGKQQPTVEGAIVDDLSADHADYRDRPVPPAAWYRAAARRLWLDVYGRSQVPAPASFQEMLDAAKDVQYPFGVMYVVEGDFVLGDQAKKGKKKQDDCKPNATKDWVVEGKLTLVVTGVLTICPRTIAFKPADTTSRFVAISLERIEFEPSGGGSRSDPLVGLYYAYDPDDLAAGSIRFPVPNRARYHIRGTLATGSLENKVDFIEVEEDPMRLLKHAAPGVPGMQAVVTEWLVGPEGGPLRQRWGLD